MKKLIFRYPHSTLSLAHRSVRFPRGASMLSYPFRFPSIWGSRGPPRAHEGFQRGDLRGAVSPLIIHSDLPFDHSHKHSSLEWHTAGGPPGIPMPPPPKLFTPPQNFRAPHSFLSRYPPPGIAREIPHPPRSHHAPPSPSIPRQNTPPILCGFLRPPGCTMMPTSKHRKASS